MKAAKHRPAEKIIEGMQEALAVAKGEAEPYKLHVRRGRPPSDASKIAIKLRLDPDIIAKFRATGEGWQTRINEVLKAAKV